LEKKATTSSRLFVYLSVCPSA